MFLYSSVEIIRYACVVQSVNAFYDVNKIIVVASHNVNYRNVFIQHPSPLFDRLRVTAPYDRLRVTVSK